MSPSSAVTACRRAPGPRRPRRPRAGWSLVETLVVVTLLGIMAGLAVRSTRPTPARALDETATLLTHALVAARSEAVMSAGDMRLYVDATGGPNGGGRVLAHRVPAGGDTSQVAPADWLALPRGTRFGPGGATRGPLGDAPAPSGVPRPAVVCQPTGDCDLGGAPVVTYYLQADTDPTLVRAITVAQVGTVRVYRYRAGGWE